MSTVDADRATGVVSDALAAIHAVLERHRVSETEWHAALAFLTEVGRAGEFVLLSDVTRTSVLIDAMEHGDDDSGATASDVEGPLYVDDPPWREAPVKVKVTAPAHEPLITQVFFPDDPYLDNDTIGAVKAALVRPVEPEGDHLLCRFDIVLRPAP